MVLSSQGRGLGYDIVAESFAQLVGVVGVDTRVMAGARDGNVGKSSVDEAARTVRVDVRQHAFGGEALCAVGSHSVAVVDVAELLRIEADNAVRLARVAGQSCAPAVCSCTTPISRFTMPSFRSAAVNWTAVARGDFSGRLAVGGDTAKPLGVVGNGLAVCFLHGDGVAVLVDRYHCGRAVALYPFCLTALAVTKYVADFVPGCPAPVGSGEVGTCCERL